MLSGCRMKIHHLPTIWSDNLVVLGEMTGMGLTGDDDVQPIDFIDI